MTALLSAELLKLRTTRTSLALVVSLLALVVLVTLAVGFGSDESFLAERTNQFQLLAEGSIASAFAALLGVLALTTEIRHGTIRPTFLATPRRRSVVVAKLLAVTIAGVVLGTIGIAISLGLGELTLHVRGVPSALDGGDIALAVAGGIGASALWGAFGVGLGAIFRNQVGAIVGLLVWTLLVENILFAVFPGQARWLPVHAANALTQIETKHQLGVTAGTLLFCAYTAIAAIAGIVVTERRDVP
jgi:ABC-2 type transport system permease protein